MTQEEFIQVLDKKGYSYKTKGDKIVVTSKDDVDLRYLTSISPGVEFRNVGGVDLRSLTSLPPGVEFRNVGDVVNGGNVWLNSLASLPPDVEFNNGGGVYLESLTSLPPGVEFNNGGDVGFISLISVYFNDWKGNLKGIDSKRLLNLMIKRGMFI